MPFESTVGESDLVIGQEYFGSIVRKVKQEVEDKDGKYIIKRFVTLKTGHILIEKYILERTLGEVKNKEYGGGHFDDEEPKDDSDSRARARAMIAKNRDKKNNRIEPEPDLDEIYDVPATVLPVSKLPDTLYDDAPVTGAWKHNDGADDTDWEPLTVIITKDPLFVEPGEPHGVVAMKKGAKRSEAGKVDSSDLNFFAPGEEPPSGYKKVGHWTPGKLNQKWPPVKPEPKSNLRNVGKLNLPDFDGEFAKVVPESQVPETQEEDAPLTGVWKHADGTDDADWEPMFVDITEDPLLDLSPEEPHGIVAVEEGVEPNEMGHLDPSDLKFFTPGEEPPRDYNKVGHWRPGKLNQDWPPVKPKPKRNVRNVRKLTLPDFDNVDATIVPKSKLPKTNGEDAPLTGVWKHNDRTDDSDWDPMDVVITIEPHLFLEPGDPHGVVAVEEGVKPNKVGKLDPSDLEFFTPGVELPLKYNKLGYWRPGKLNQDWPPVKPTLPDFDGPAKVVPKSKAPMTQGSDAPLTGVWKHNDGTDDTDWDPIDVIITKEPVSFLEQGEFHGIVAVEDRVKPNKVGKLDPSDLKFFTPGEEPPPKYNKVGHWRPGKLNQDWPPSKPKAPVKPPPKRIVRDFEKPALPSFDGSFAKVFPESKLHERSKKDPPLAGVWKHNDDTDDTDWEPMGVIITKDPPSDLDKDEFHGIVAVEDGVKPDKTGKLNPSDLKFFTPGEEPSPKYNKVGHWRPGNKVGWPPVKPSTARNLRNVGKLNLPSFDGIPDLGVIYPRSQAPESHDETKEQIIAKGIWKWSKQEKNPEDSESWMPSNVELYEDGNEPHDWDDKQTNGVWGVNPDVDAKVNTRPSDLWFYPPNEKTDEGFEPIGKWRPSKKSEKEEWSYPPKSVGRVEDKREFKEFERSQNSVGKLRMPSFYKGK
jgi:hypothetical protein